MPTIAVKIPQRPFMWTIDQIAQILALPERRVRTELLYYQGRSSGLSNGRMVARNIIPDPNVRPEWRVSDLELRAFLKRRGFRIEANR